MIRPFQCLLLASALAVAFLPACDPASLDPEEESSADINLEALILSEEPSDESTPRIVASAGDWSFAEMATTDSDQPIVLELFNTKTRDEVVYVYNEGDLWIVPCSLSDSITPLDTVLRVQVQPQQFDLSLCVADWSGNSLTVCREISLKRLVTKASGKDDMAFARESMYKMLEEFRDRISNVGDLFGFLKPVHRYIPGASFAGSTIDVLSVFIIPSIEMKLYEDDPGRQLQIQNSMVYGGIKTVTTKLLPSNTQRIVHGYNLVKSGKSLWGGAGEAVSDEEINKMSQGIQVSLPSSIPSSIQVFKLGGTTPVDPRAKYKVSMLKPYDITAESVTLMGSYEIYDGNPSYISKMGFVVFNKEEERVIESKGLDETVVDGLKPGRSYGAYAFLDAMGERYQSETQSFATPGNLFDVSPTTLQFEKEGGTKGVAVTVNEGTKWEIKDDYPSWCSIEKGDGTFFITVEAAPEPRSGNITVTATFPSGETAEEHVSIEQEGMNIGLDFTNYLALFDGQGIMRYRYTNFDDKNEDETDNRSESAMLTVNNGQYTLSFSLYYIDLLNWGVGNTPPGFTMNNEYNLEYDNYSCSVSASSVRIEGTASYNDSWEKDYHNGVGSGWYRNGWEKTSYHFSIEINGLDTETPSMRFEESFNNEYYDKTKYDSMWGTVIIHNQRIRDYSGDLTCSVKAPIL